MKQINIHQAKTNLSKLIEKIELGEEIIIANRGVPKAVIKKYISESTEQDNPFGRYAGQHGDWICSLAESIPHRQIEISDDFNDEDEEINNLFGI